MRGAIIGLLLLAVVPLARAEDPPAPEQGMCEYLDRIPEVFDPLCVSSVDGIETLSCADTCRELTCEGEGCAVSPTCGEDSEGCTTIVVAGLADTEVVGGQQVSEVKYCAPQGSSITILRKMLAVPVCNE